MLGLRRWIPNDPPPWAAPALAGLLGLVGFTIAGLSCSLIVETRSTQCERDADCAKFPNAACDTKTHACVDRDLLACEKGDCVCDPKTPTDILNACPRGDCTPFDNGRVTKVVNGEKPSLPAGDPGIGGAHSADECPTGSSSSAGGGGAGGAPAVQICEDLPSPLYVLGPGSIKPLLGWVGRHFAAGGTTTVVYQDESSCIALQQVYDQGFMETPPGHEAWTAYFDADGNEHPCRFVATDVRPHIGISDVYPQTCGYDLNGSDPNITNTPGPVQAFGFIAPLASKQEAISGEAAYMVYGFGDDSGVTPWNDRSYIYQRSPSSGTQHTIAKTLGIPSDRFFATPTASSHDEATLVGCSDAPDKTIGILAVDLAQSGEYPIKVLAYQHDDQTCAYLPDSTASANDKRPVRDGHYFIWAALHMLTHESNPSAKATELIQFVSGIKPPPDDEIDLFQVWADAHLVPQCAMRVTRGSDGGPLASFKPTISCYCKYDEVTRGSADCDKCQTASDCPAERPACTLGYCEVE